MNMEFKDMTERLTEEQKKRLAEVKTEDDLKKLLLEDEKLNKVAGGWFKRPSAPGGCFRPEDRWVREWGWKDDYCPECGTMISRDVTRCPKCGTTWDNIDYDYKYYLHTLIENKDPSLRGL